MKKANDVGGPVLFFLHLLNHCILHYPGCMVGCLLPPRRVTPPRIPPEPPSTRSEHGWTLGLQTPACSVFTPYRSCRFPTHTTHISYYTFTTRFLVCGCRRHFLTRFLPRCYIIVPAGSWLRATFRCISFTRTLYTRLLPDHTQRCVGAFLVVCLAFSPAFFPAYTLPLFPLTWCIPFEALQLHILGDSSPLLEYCAFSLFMLPFFA